MRKILKVNSSTFQDSSNGPQTKDSSTSALNSDEIKQLIQDFEHLNFEHVGDINIIVEKFAYILETAAKQSLKIVKQNKTQNVTPNFGLITNAAAPGKI